MNRTHNPSLGASQQSRLLALTLSAVFTLSILSSIHTLAGKPVQEGLLAASPAASQVVMVSTPRAAHS